MDSKFVPNPAKRPFDFAMNRPISNGTAAKKFNFGSSFPSAKPPPPPLKLSPGETFFKILCPSIKIGGVIGKGGSIIKRFREETGAKIRIEESVPGCEERVVLVVGSGSKNVRADMEQDLENIEEDEDDDGGEEESEKEAGAGVSADVSPAQQALVRVFERILEVDEGKFGGEVGGDAEKKIPAKGPVVCRMLAPTDQVGFVIGKGGKVVKKIRRETGAQVRVLPREQLPACAAATDELVQILGTVPAVKKAILSVSGCLRDNPRSDASNTAAAIPQGAVPRGTGLPAQVETLPQRGYAQVETLPQRGYAPGASNLDYHSGGYSSIAGSDSIAAGHNSIQEVEVVFRLLCLDDKVGGLIGKGGTIVRALQTETGASIKVAGSVSDSEERVIVISARENSELKHSSAQDAVIRVHDRIVETGLEKGTTASARLLVPSPHVGCLLGKGGSIIAEMRRATGAIIQILAKDQVPKCASKNDVVVEVTGSLQSVHEALIHITSRLRDTILPAKPHPGAGTGTYLSSAHDIPPPSSAPHSSFRARNEPISTGSYSSIGLSHDPDRLYGQPALAYSMDNRGLAGVDQPPYPYSSERLGHGTNYPSPPRQWPPPQTASIGNYGGPDMGRGMTDSGRSIPPRSGGFGSGSQKAIVTNTTVEVAVPQRLMGSIYGENGSNLNQIKQISGAKVTTHDPRPGTTEALVIISGTPDQTLAAQSLLQAFILSGQDLS